MDELEKAALMLAVAKDAIMGITDAPMVNTNVWDGSLEVHIVDDEKFDLLSIGREVKARHHDGHQDYPVEKSFWLHGVKFFNLRKEV